MHTCNLVDTGDHQAATGDGLPLLDWYVQELHPRKREELLMLMKASWTNVKLMLKPKWVGSLKLQMITGVDAEAATDNEKKVHALMGRLKIGVKLEWQGEPGQAVGYRQVRLAAEGKDCQEQGEPGQAQ
jgi:hypothetical protein